MRSLACILSIFLFTIAVSAQVLRIADLNTEQIKRLDRSKTIVIIPGGILEQHGPYLPSGTDTFFNERLSERIAEAIAARKGYTALLFPTIYLGAGGAEVIGRHTTFPGTYTVRTETLRNVYMDLGDRLGRDGFKKIFLVHNHGAPFHHRALVTAGEYFHDTYGGDMVHLLTLLDLYFCCDRTSQYLTPDQVKENGFTVHAGAGEHSSVMFLRPELVPDSVRTAPSFTGKDANHLVQIAREPNWTGYFGAPRYASAALGAAEFAGYSEMAIATVMKILDGAGYRFMKHYADFMAADPAVVGIDRDALAEEDRLKRQQEAWLANHKAVPQKK